MANRPTIADIARVSGVSVATVDRVLNKRHPVREETARRVYEAAQSIGFHAAALIRQRLAADLPELTFGFLLQRGEQAFYKKLGAAFQTAVDDARNIRGRAIIESLPEQTPAGVVEKIESLGRRCQAVALTSIDHPMVTKSVDELRSRGVPCFSFLSDFAPGTRESYVGLNNRKCGRTAAWLIWKTSRKPGKIAVFVGGHRWHGHELREIGFRSFFREHAPEFTVLETLVNLDTQAVTYEATLGLLDRIPDLAGIYIAGGGMEGAIEALREVAPRRPLPSVVINEVTPESTAALEEHLVTAVISTPVDQMSRTLVSMMTNAVLNGPAQTPGQHFLPFDLVVPESI